MTIEEALEHCGNMENYYMDETYELSEFLKEQNKEIDQLKSDRLEMAEAYYYGDFNPPLRLKADQIIKESKEDVENSKL